MFWRGMLSCAVAIGLAGCVSDRVGTDYAAIVQKVGPPKPGQSRIVVLEEKRQGISTFCGCAMKLDGELIGTVTPGTYVYADRPAGRHQFVASESLFPGETKKDFDTDAGRTYFFLVRSSKRHDAVAGATMAGGLVGLAAASVVTSGSPNAGPAELFPLDEPTAKMTLAELQLAQ